MTTSPHLARLARLARFTDEELIEAADELDASAAAVTGVADDLAEFLDAIAHDLRTAATGRAAA